MTVPPRQPLHLAAFLIDRDERHQRGLGVAQERRQRAELLGRTDILRIEHHPADGAFGQLIAHRLHAGIALVVAEEADHDHLPDHRVEARVGRERRLGVAGGAEAGQRHAERQQHGREQGPGHGRQAAQHHGQFTGARERH